MAPPPELVLDGPNLPQFHGGSPPPNPDENDETNQWKNDRDWGFCMFKILGKKFQKYDPKSQMVVCSIL